MATKTKKKVREEREEDIPQGINVTEKRKRGDDRPTTKGRPKFGGPGPNDKGGTFELLASTFTDNDGTLYEFEAGKRCVIESDKPLDKLFMNKFRRLGGKNLRPRDLRDDLDDGGTTRTTDRPKHMREDEEGERKTARKKGRNSKFYDEDEEELKTDAEEGDEEETEEEEGAEEGDEGEEEGDDAAAKKSKFGKEVTSQFDAAANANLLVFKKKDKFTVVDADEPEKAVKGGSDLADKAKVEKFLGKQAHRQRQGT